jgi:mRNA-degrading endonuclease HigB of HigAB toxin-antitoxin module
METLRLYRLEEKCVGVVSSPVCNVRFAGTHAEYDRVNAEKI